MSRTQPTPRQRGTLTYDCPQCAAVIGQWCYLYVRETHRGAITHYAPTLHHDRLKLYDDDAARRVRGVRYPNGTDTPEANYVAEYRPY